MPRVCKMEGVRSDDGLPVELWRDDVSGRLMVRAYNEAGHSYTEIDLWDLVDWLSSGQGAGVLPSAESECGASRDHPE